MSYKIKSAVLDGSNLRILASFHNGLYEGSFLFSSDATESDVLSKLNTTEAGYQTEQKMKDALPDKFKNLVGYTKD